NLFGRPATLTRLGNVFDGTHLKCLLRGASCGGATRRSRATGRASGRARGAGDLYFVTNMLAEFRGISGQLISGTALVADGVAPVGTAQTTLHGCLAARGR